MSWAKFFDMGGYAFYVWGSFGVALGLMAAEVLLLRRRRKRLLSLKSERATQSGFVKKYETTT
jgi:heme exporter protein D